MTIDINHILGHETNLNKSKRTEIIQSIFSDHTRIKLEIDNQKIIEKIIEKSPNAWKQNITILNNSGAKEKNSRELTTFELNENYNTK